MHAQLIEIKKKIFHLQTQNMYVHYSCVLNWVHEYLSTEFLNVQKT